jgi:branched-chain amino acid transport system permease protein
VLASAVMLGWAGSNNYRLSIVTLMVAYSFIALGMYVPVAWAGSLSLAYGAYAAIGAYSVAYLSTEHGWPVWGGWAVGVVLAATFAIIIGLATARLLGFYLVAATLLFATAFETWLDNTLELGSSNGIVGVPDLSLFGWSPGKQTVVAGGVVIVLLVAFAIHRVRSSRWGVIVRSIGEAPVVPSSSGVPVGRMTIVVLAIGAMFAALGGSFFVTAVGGITPETFNMNIVFLALFMPLLGGLGTPWGAVVGAMLTVQLTVQWDIFSGGGLFVLSIAVVLVLLVAPAGVLGWLSKGVELVTGRQRRNGASHV